MHKDLYDKLVRMYDDGSPNHIVDGIYLHPPHVRVSTQFLCEMDVTLYLLMCLSSPHYRPQMCRVDLLLPQPLCGQAYVPIQPWPPPVFLLFAQPLSQESTAPCLKASRGGGR